MSSHIYKKSAQGALFLLFRAIGVQGVNIIGSILLARVLSVEEYGFYAVIFFLSNLLISISDKGLGGALIYRRKEPTAKDLRIIFTFQQAIMLAAVILLWIISPLLVQSYHLNTEHAIWLFRVLGVAVICASFQAIPYILLERKLDFGKIAVIDFTQAAVFNVSAVTMAVMGYGVWSFAIALLLRFLLGAIIANYVVKWKVGWLWNWKLGKHYLRFGIPLQLTSLVSLAKDSIAPIFIGMFLSLQAVGEVSWAAMLAAYITIVLMIMQRIYFPAFAKLKNDKKALKKLVDSILIISNVVVACVSIVTLIFIENLVTIIFGDKWLPAIPIFLCFWVANIFVPSTTPLLALLNAYGRTDISLMLTVTWLILTWVVGVPLIYYYGAIGFGVANVIVQFSNIIIYEIVKRKYIDVAVYVTILKVWLPAVVLIPLFYFLKSFISISDWLHLLGYALAFGVACFFVYALIYLDYTKFLWYKIRRRQTYVI